MQDTEINKIEDARLLGIIDKISTKDKSFEEYKKELEKAIQRAEKIGMNACGRSAMADYAPIQMPTDEILRETFSYSSQEDHIIDSSVSLLQDRERSVNNERKPVQKDWEINEIGQNIADGPGLTVLDGGPGAGKSYSLGKAVDVMQVPVICLGSTASAAAGLYKDMNDAQSDKDKEEEKNKKRIQNGEQPKDIAPKVDILGGLTVDQLLQNEPLEDSELQARKKQVLEILGKEPKPCVMVDEAGLLGHEQMEKLLKFAEENGTKLILAGDCQQIPEGNGQPFKMIVESVKGTPAYVNAPYVFRQSVFSEKAITSGIYHGLSSGDDKSINKEIATEFLEAAYTIKGGPAKPPKNGELSFQDYLNTDKFKDMPGDTPVQKYVAYLEENKTSLLEAGTGNILKNYEAHAEYESACKALEEAKKAREKALEEGKTDLPPLPKVPEKPKEEKPSYDSYMCAVLAAQQMGVQAYCELNNGAKKEPPENVYADVAADFADHYLESVTNGFNARKRDALGKGKDLNELKPEYADGMLAITATTDEAEKLNAAIRAKMIEQGKLPEKEPVIINGDRKLLSQAEIEAAQKDGQKIEYAYALDVKTTQGMSQNGKVTFVVRGDTMNQMHGGEILVGATRHKGNFEIKMDEAASKRKDEFYKASTQQYASRRIIHNENQPAIRNAAMKREQPAKAQEPKKKGLQDKIGAHQTAKTEEPKKKGLQNNISAHQTAKAKDPKNSPEKGNQAVIRQISGGKSH